MVRALWPALVRDRPRVRRLPARPDRIGAVAVPVRGPRAIGGAPS